MQHLAEFLCFDHAGPLIGTNFLLDESFQTLDGDVLFLHASDFLKKRFIEQGNLNTVLVEKVDHAISVNGLLKDVAYTLVEFGVGHASTTVTFTPGKAKYLNTQNRQISCFVLVLFRNQALA